MENVYDIVFSYDKVKDYLKKHPDDEKKMISCIDEIKGAYSDVAISALETFLDKTFVKLYDGINLEVPEDFDLNSVLNDYHVILCPNHQSHADYIAIQYVLYKKYQLPVFIAAGINLNIFPIGKLFQKCGAFFIRRKFDDETYKIAFQGYIYYLLKTDKVVEFFFEGGRTRTGKLLPPKYGLFNMILDAHSKFGSQKKPLMFIPVSIAHEHIPEEGAHAKELGGAKKEKEKASQLLKLFGLFSKRLGTVHVKFSEGIVVDKEVEDLKTKTSDLAFECFRKVGQGMPITPTALLSLILLDEPTGALTWKQIDERVKDLLNYCNHMNIGVTQSLKGGKASYSVKRAMDLFINNKKVKLIKREKLNQIYYTVEEDSRVNLLFHKNMILHHFFAPAVINMVWFNIFSGEIKTATELRSFLFEKRQELKYEFYLPRTSELVDEGIKIVSFYVGRQIKSVNEILKLSRDDLYKVASNVRRFSAVLSYIYEAYYISAVTIKYLSDDKFSIDKFLQVSKELFEMEMEHGRVVKFSEAYTVPKLKSTLGYFESLKIIEKNAKGYFLVKDQNGLGHMIEKFAKDISDQVSLNIKLNHHD